MKTKDLIELFNKGVRPVIKFNTNINNIDSADCGMLGRITGIDNIESFDDGWKTVEVHIDLSEFIDKNKEIAKNNARWYDKYGKPTLNFFETIYYPENHIINFYLDYSNPTDGLCDVYYFDIVDNKYSIEFLKQDEILDYVKFLENKLDKIENENYKNSNEQKQ